MLRRITIVGTRQDLIKAIKSSYPSAVVSSMTCVDGKWTALFTA